MTDNKSRPSSTSQVQFLSSSSPSSSSHAQNNEKNNQYHSVRMTKGVLKKPTVPIITESDSEITLPPPPPPPPSTQPFKHNTTNKSYEMLYKPNVTTSCGGVADGSKQHSIYIIDASNRNNNLNQGGTHIGYVGSQSNMRHDGSTPSIQVIREQYWSWSCPVMRCQNWTKREKILFGILAALSCVVVALVIVVSVLAGDEAELTPDWLPWTL